MTSQEKYNAIINAYETKEAVNDSRKTIQVIKATTSQEIGDKLVDIQYALDIDFNLSYEVTSKACDIISSLTIEQIQSPNIDLNELVQNACSVYTWDQLQVLDANNQAEITDIIKEHNSNDVDIACACAIWYDNKVTEALQALINYINQ